MKTWARRHALAIAAVGLLLAALVSLMVGDMPLTLAQLGAGLSRSDELAATILWELRIPRLLVAIEIGAALAA